MMPDAAALDVTLGVALDVAQIDASHVQACLPSLGRAAVERLQGCARLHGRLRALVTQHYGLAALPPSEGGGPLVRLAAASPGKIRVAGQLMGAAWYACSIQRVVDRTQVVALIERIGAPARLFALQHLALATAPGEAMTPDELADAVHQAADACLGAWLGLLPAGVRERAALKLPAGFAVFADSDPCLGPIAARAAETVLVP